MDAPQFTLPDETGTLHSLKDYLGKWVVLYFYPKDDTPGCTKEACNFRDSLVQFTDRDVVIFGISKDSVVSHKKFKDKFSLNFHLLSDESTDTIKAYNAWGEKKFLGKTFQGIQRNTILIDPQGKIKKVYEKVDPGTHYRELLEDINNFKAV